MTNKKKATQKQKERQRSEIYKDLKKEIITK